MLNKTQFFVCNDILISLDFTVLVFKSQRVMLVREKTGM